MRDALTRHWPEYLMEAAGLGLFMVSAALFASILEHPASPVRRAVPDAFVRRLLMGIAMGGTAVAIIRSPWGQRSGAHINPAITFTFLRLGRVAPWDALFYGAAQFAGGLAGILAAGVLLRGVLSDPAVRFVATLPGPRGAAVAFAAEVAISFLLMTMVLVTTNAPRLAPWTARFAGVLVALYITFEAPLSGMSMNPARTFASAVPAAAWDSLWIYFLAPPLGMLLAAETYARLRGAAAVRCAKLDHLNDKRCIFRCGYAADHTAMPASAGVTPVGQRTTREERSS